MLVNNSTSITDGFRTNKDRRIKSITADSVEISSTKRTVKSIEIQPSKSMWPESYLIKVISELHKISAHSPDVQLKVLKALKHCGLPYSLYLSWVVWSGNKIYADHRKWKLLRSDHENPITLRTLFWLAKNDDFTPSSRARRKRSNYALSVWHADKQAVIKVGFFLTAYIVAPTPVCPIW